jgi:hypothetical protein
MEYKISSMKDVSIPELDDKKDKITKLKSKHLMNRTSNYLSIFFRNGLK